jgi:hypothetical protein
MLLDMPPLVGSYCLDSQQGSRCGLALVLALWPLQGQGHKLTTQATIAPLA